MNKTMTAMMKPINPDTIRSNSEDTKAMQNAIVLDILRNSPYSMSSYDVGQAINTDTMPGYRDYSDRRRYIRPDLVRTQFASRIFKRLESKGEVISVLYQGRRLYSIPATPDELMKAFLNGGEN